VFAGEAFIKVVYETIRRSPVWSQSLLVLTWDEHGGFYDHVHPGKARATGSTGKDNGFMFDQLGPRVPAVVISPLIPRNLVDHRIYDHTSVPATLQRQLGLGHLTERVGEAADLAHLVTLMAPRATPDTLPVPSNGTTWKKRSQRRPLIPSAKPLDKSSENYGFMLRTLVASHLKLEPNNRDAIIARANGLATVADYVRYTNEVHAMIRAKRTASPWRATLFST
jgi:phospholipase C